ncbi:MAG: adenylyl-sulfate kinase [bacterium]|jgi:adenylylsulfate kinase
MIIQIIGLPGSGKTALATALKERINAIHLNADEVRSTVNSDLGFTAEDRIEQARRMGEMARLIANQGVAPVIVDFVCPTKETREAFGPANIVVWVDRIKQGRFEDTNKMWQDPERFDIRILDGYTLDQEVDTVIQVGALFDWSAPTTLQLGRYQPWHEGHQALKEEAHKRTKQVLVGVRNTYKTSEKDPLKYDEVATYIHQDNPFKDTLVLRLPNITNIVYGRDVGYKIEQVDLGADIHAISATQKRKEMGI